MLSCKPVSWRRLVTTSSSLSAPSSSRLVVKKVTTTKPTNAPLSCSSMTTVTSSPEAVFLRTLTSSHHSNYRPDGKNARTTNRRYGDLYGTDKTSSALLPAKRPPSIVVPTRQNTVQTRRHVSTTSLQFCPMPSTDSSTNRKVTARRLKSSSTAAWDEDFATPAVADDAQQKQQQQQNQRTPFLLADIGEGIAEVELLQWFVQPGEIVQQFDRICEVQSDKATVEITSRYDGRIASLEHQVGDMVPVGSPLLFLDATPADDTVASASSSLFSSDDSPSPPSSAGTSSPSLHTASTANEPKEYDERLHIPTIAARYHLSTDDPEDFKDFNQRLAASGMSSSQREGGGTPATSTAVVGNGLTTNVQTSPAIRKLAKEHNLDLSTIVGTGPQGRVLKGDVLTVLKERNILRSSDGDGIVSSSSTSSTSHIHSPPPATIVGSTESKEAANTEINPPTITSLDQLECPGMPLKEDTIFELRGYNRLMVQSMTASLQIPHMVFADEVHVSQLLSYKKHIPFLPFAIKAVSQSLLEYPILNSSFLVDGNNGGVSQTSGSNGDNHVMLWKDHNIGIAMDTPRGLVVPVIHNVQEKSILDIVDDLVRLKELARGTTAAEDSSTSSSSSSARLSSQDLKGATFSLSNIGAVGCGGTYMSPIVTSPQVAIGAMGTIQRLPRFVNENNHSHDMTVQEQHICNISWGADHRIVDGATLARFHATWKGFMEDPLTLISQLK